jgi:hypothetical protein
VEPQGRAIDILIGLEAAPRENPHIGLDYRILEEGADVDAV